MIIPEPLTVLLVRPLDEMETTLGVGRVLVQKYGIDRLERGRPTWLN